MELVGGVSGFVDSTIEIPLGKLLQVDEYEEIWDHGFLDEVLDSAIIGTISGGIFGGLSLGTRKVFSETLYRLKGANIPIVKTYLQKMAKRIKWSPDKLMKELKEVYGNLHPNDLYRAFAKDPLLFFVNAPKDTMQAAIMPAVMPGKIESSIGGVITSEMVEELVKETFEEDDAKYVEGFILRPATAD